VCEKQSKALEALAKVKDGANFAEVPPPSPAALTPRQVARNYSEDKARNGGDLGWQTRGAMV
jgi:peptidyl-prolyl cis-trans isomerase NIMA-interacting 4